MTKPIITIYNSQTGQVTEREMNAIELSQYKADQEDALAKEEAEAAKAANKAALLDRLGITADEAKLLLS